MSATKTLAYVLGTQDYRDTSLLARLYTRDFGKVHGILKGVRDSRGRYGSTLEPFSLNEILFYRRRRGGDLHQVTHAELVEPYTSVREDLERMSFASYFAELVDRMVEPEEAAPEVFDLLTDALGLLSAGVSPKRAARIFEVKLFELLGLVPETAACVKCRVPEPDPAYFNVALGGILCQNCSSDRPAPGSGSALQPLSRGTLHFLEHVQRAAVRELVNVKVSETVGVELEKALRRFVDYHLPGKLKTVVFLEKMGWQ